MSELDDAPVMCGSRWYHTKKGELPPKNKYTDTIVLVSNGEMEWITADKFDGYSGTFEDNYCPKNSVRVVKWCLLPSE